MKSILLSSAFYAAIEPVTNNFENDNYKAILAQVDWEAEAKRCYNALVGFFRDTAPRLLANTRESIGVVDICWNEYGGNIEVDFMPGNDLETAFDEGCIMNTSAIDNDGFFEQYFSISGEDSFQVIDRDYSGLIMYFYKLIGEVIASVAKTEEFQSLPLKAPFYVTFSFFHDDERDVIFEG
ncbi:hypothetical protein LVD17_22340 [Fulvivirga ulvae]|uniref:hypothetical protein n=1 Tax=Fulvivirga ulvae TaxID=2904245 RepID=UPI001F3D8BF7|nr:hypothetical protein [Fulvivirga ulvae]UII31035.1 hypothetical protein LVD17_22340 [Fulvivirga ulvae]